MTAIRSDWACGRIALKKVMPCIPRYCAVPRSDGHHAICSLNRYVRGILTIAHLVPKTMLDAVRGVQNCTCTTAVSQRISVAAGNVPNTHVQVND